MDEPPKPPPKPIQHKIVDTSTAFVNGRGNTLPVGAPRANLNSVNKSLSSFTRSAYTGPPRRLPEIPQIQTSQTLQGESQQGSPGFYSNTQFPISPNQLGVQSQLPSHSHSPLHSPSQSKRDSFMDSFGRPQSEEPSSPSVASSNSGNYVNVQSFPSQFGIRQRIAIKPHISQTSSPLTMSLPSVSSSHSPGFSNLPSPYSSGSLGTRPGSIFSTRSLSLVGPPAVLNSSSPDKDRNSLLLSRPPQQPSVLARPSINVPPQKPVPHQPLPAPPTSFAPLDSSQYPTMPPIPQHSFKSSTTFRLSSRPGTGDSINPLDDLLNTGNYNQESSDSDEKSSPALRQSPAFAQEATPKTANEWGMLDKESQRSLSPVSIMNRGRPNSPSNYSCSSPPPSVSGHNTNLTSSRMQLGLSQTTASSSDSFISTYSSKAQTSPTQSTGSGRVSNVSTSKSTSPQSSTSIMDRPRPKTPDAYSSLDSISSIPDRELRQPSSADRSRSTTLELASLTPTPTSILDRPRPRSPEVYLSYDRAPSPDERSVAQIAPSILDRSRPKSPDNYINLGHRSQHSFGSSVTLDRSFSASAATTPRPSENIESRSFSDGLQRDNGVANKLSSLGETSEFNPTFNLDESDFTTRLNSLGEPPKLDLSFNFDFGATDLLSGLGDFGTSQESSRTSLPPPSQNHLGSDALSQTRSSHKSRPSLASSGHESSNSNGESEASAIRKFSSDQASIHRPPLHHSATSHSQRSASAEDDRIYGGASLESDDEATREDSTADYSEATLTDSAMIKEEMAASQFTWTSTSTPSPAVADDSSIIDLSHQVSSGYTPQPTPASQIEPVESTIPPKGFKKRRKSFASLLSFTGNNDKEPEAPVSKDPYVEPSVESKVINPKPRKRGMSLSGLSVLGLGNSTTSLVASTTTSASTNADSETNAYSSQTVTASPISTPVADDNGFPSLEKNLPTIPGESPYSRNHSTASGSTSNLISRQFKKFQPASGFQLVSATSSRKPYKGGNGSTISLDNSSVASHGGVSSDDHRTREFSDSRLNVLEENVPNCIPGHTNPTKMKKRKGSFSGMLKDTFHIGSKNGERERAKVREPGTETIGMSLKNRSADILSFSTSASRPSMDALRGEVSLIPKQVDSMSAPHRDRIGSSTPDNNRPLPSLPSPDTDDEGTSDVSIATARVTQLETSSATPNIPDETQRTVSAQRNVHNAKPQPPAKQNAPPPVKLPLVIPPLNRAPTQSKGGPRKMLTIKRKGRSHAMYSVGDNSMSRGWLDLEDALKAYILALSDNRPDRGQIVNNVLLPFLRKEEDTPGPIPDIESARRQRQILFKWLATLTSELRDQQPTHRGACLEAVASIAESHFMSAAVLEEDPESAAMYHTSIVNVLSFAVEKLNDKAVYANTLVFSGRVFALAFFRIEGVAVKLLRALPAIKKQFLKRILDEAGVDEFNLPEVDLDAFPKHLWPLCLTDMKAYSDTLLTTVSRPSPADDRYLVQDRDVVVEMSGNWLIRWTASDSDLPFAFYRAYHRQLANQLIPTDFKDDILRSEPPMDPSLVITAPGALFLAASLLEKSDALVHRNLRSVTSIGPNNANFNTNDSANLNFGQKPKVLELANRRLVSTMLDIVGGSPPAPGETSDLAPDADQRRHAFSQMLQVWIRACVKRTSMWDTRSVFILLDLIEGLIYTLSYPAPSLKGSEEEIIVPRPHISCIEMFDIPFIMSFVKIILGNADNTVALMRTIAFIYAHFEIFTLRPEDRDELCERLILDEVLFTRLYLHWNAGVRGYFIRLLVWRLARLGVVEQEQHPNKPRDPRILEIFSLLNIRLEAIRKRHDELEPLDDLSDDDYFKPKRSTICSTRGVKEMPFTVDELTPLPDTREEEEPTERVPVVPASSPVPKAKSGGLKEVATVAKVVSWLKVGLGKAKNNKRTGESRVQPFLVETLPQSEEPKDEDGPYDELNISMVHDRLNKAPHKKKPKTPPGHPVAPAFFSFDFEGGLAPSDPERQKVNSSASSIHSNASGENVFPMSPARRTFEPGAAPSPRVSKRFSKRASILPPAALDHLQENGELVPPIPAQYLIDSPTYYDKRLHPYAVRGLRDYEDALDEWTDWVARLQEEEDDGKKHNKGFMDVVPRLSVAWPQSFEDGA